MRRGGVEDQLPDAVGQRQLGDAQLIQQAEVAQASEGGERGRLEDVAGECVGGQQSECGGAGGAQQASGVCVGEEGVEDGQDGVQSVEQGVVELGSDARRAAQWLAVIELRSPLHRRGERVQRAANGVGDGGRRTQ